MVTGLGDSSHSKVTFQPGGAKQISEASSLEKEPTMYTNFFFSFFSRDKAAIIGSVREDDVSEDGVLKG